MYPDCLPASEWGAVDWYDGGMRRFVLVILIAITIFVVADIIRHWNAADKSQRNESIVLISSAWFVFWMFDLVRAVEQRKRDRNPQKYSIPVSAPAALAPAPPLSFGEFLFAIRGSLILAIVIIFFDAIDGGTFMLAYMVCPIWFLVALIRASFGRVSARVNTVRVLVPIATGLLVFGNFMLQREIAMARAAQIVAACKHYPCR